MKSTGWEGLTLKFIIHEIIVPGGLTGNTHFFINNTFISNAKLKLAENQPKAKQHPETELLLFEGSLFSLSTLSCKNNSRYSKKCV